MGRLIEKYGFSLQILTWGSSPRILSNRTTQPKEAKGIRLVHTICKVTHLYNTSIRTPNLTRGPILKTLMSEFRVKTGVINMILNHTTRPIHALWNETVAKEKCDN